MSSQMTSSTCAEGVNLLASLLPRRTILAGTAEYERLCGSYWAKDQMAARPGCFYRPESTREISLGLIVLQYAGCPFAVKSGGHGKFLGESSISGGVTIDLKKINHLVISECGSMVDIGPGNTWGEVYAALEPLGLTVVGGRASSVGVGGFTLGGGISFYSNKYGWSADNVEEYEIVLADGSIRKANPSSNPDLYRALRGGGANFGIVTNMRFRLRSCTLMWTGSRIFDADEHTDKAVSAFLDYGRDDVNNVDLSIILAITVLEGRWVVGCDVLYLKPEAPRSLPSIDALMEIPVVMEQPEGRVSLTQRCKEMADYFPPNYHNAFWVFCTKPDADIIRFYLDTWMDETKDLVGILGGHQALLADCQFITAEVVKAMRRNGGNALGIADHGPFLMMNMQPQWQDADQSPLVFRALHNTCHKVTAEARRRGLAHDYIYPNYASQFQDPFGAYGPEMQAFLRQVSLKYDPSGVFQHLRRSGFNLSGPFEKYSEAKL